MRLWRWHVSAAERSLNPELVECFCERAGELLALLDATTGWDAVIDAQPGLRQTLSDVELDGALEAIADFADLKSPYTMGHSRAVADLAAQAGRLNGIPEDDVRRVRRAGLVHDLGRLGVSNAIWDKRGPLTAFERERVRLHPYLTERMLSESAVLAPLGALASQHHERLDGSGYPRGLKASMLAPPAWILAAADAYRAMLEPRPHRDPRSALVAAHEVWAQARGGRLDGDAVEAVEAVLRAAGHERSRRPERPGGLTTREVEISDGAARRICCGRRRAARHEPHGGAVWNEALASRARSADGVRAGRTQLRSARPVPGSARADRSLAAYDGTGYDLVTMFYCLHDMSDPLGAARQVHSTLAKDGTWMIVEPNAGDEVEDNLNPVGRAYYAFSTLL
jgi:HD-GYP domain-containing protein (c-di-GMP phosphodiesterase class II)